MPASVIEAPEVEELYRSLEAKVRALRPNADIAALERAYRFADEHHQHKMRRSGEPYIVHPLAVAHTRLDRKMDSACIDAGLLHDVREDTGATREEVEQPCGEEVARI